MKHHALHFSGFYHLSVHTKHVQTRCVVKIKACRDWEQMGSNGTCGIPIAMGMRNKSLFVMKGMGINVMGSNFPLQYNVASTGN